MGVFGYLKEVFRNPKKSYMAYVDGSQPVFTSFGKDIYLSDFVNNAIDRVASEISKIEIKSIVDVGESVEIQNDDLTRLFRYKPNPLQTTSDFLSNVEWLRRKDRNVFIYPQYEVIRLPNGREYKKYIAMYPLKPSGISIGTRDGQPWEIQFDFEDGSRYTLPYGELIHLRWRRGSNTIMGGGDDNGKVNDYEIRRTIDALDKTIQGLPKSIEASLQVKGVYTSKTLVDGYKFGTLNEMRDDFEDHIRRSKTGIIATDLGGDFTPVNMRQANVPQNVLRFLKAVIEERYGVSAAILSGDYNGEQHGAFYQTAIEDFIVQFEQAASACLFTPRELDVGHRIKCYYNKVNYLSTSDKLQLASLAKETGVMTLNEINDMFGIMPFAGGDRRLQSLNYVSLDHVDGYQKGRAGVAGAKKKEEAEPNEEESE
jgi:hypothetical protein